MKRTGFIAILLKKKDGGTPWRGNSFPLGNWKSTACTSYGRAKHSELLWKPREGTVITSGSL